MLKNGLSYGLIQKFAVLYLVIWTISPPMEIGTVYRIAALACAGIWFVIWLIRENPILLGKDQIYALIFMIAVIVIIYIESEKLSNIIKQIAIFMIVICFIMNYFYRGKWDELSGIIPIVLILLIIWNFKTVTALIDDPTIARRLIRDDESTYVYLQQGIGGYNLVYPQVCICPLILAWIIKSFKNNKIYFILGAVWLVTYVRLIAAAGYSIAIFASVVGVILLFLYRGQSGIAAFVVAAAIFIAAMLSILYLDGFREWLLQIFDGTAVAKKINDLVSTADTGETGESIQLRIIAYSESLKNIFKYPIIGSLWRGNGGGHSAFLDIISKYGVLGGIIFSKMFYTSPNYYKNKFDNQFIISVSNATLISMLFVTVLDSFNYSFTCMILIIAPLLFEDIIKWTGVNEK